MKINVHLICYGLILIGIFSPWTCLWAYPPAGDSVVIMAPASPASIPLITASRRMARTRIQIFTNHSQAHSLFLKEKNRILSTGLSVATRFYQDHIPIQIINSYISGLSYLVTTKAGVKFFRDLKKTVIYLPFEGSPIEEITTYFIRQEGLRIPDDIRYSYSPLQATVELLRQGKIQSAILPEPYVSILMAGRTPLYTAINYYDRWQELTGKCTGYPQIGIIVKSDWAIKNSAYIQRFNQLIQEVIQVIQTDPEKAAEMVEDYMQYPLPVLKSAISQTRYELLTSQELKQEILEYYRIIGKPLDETFKDFFYFNPQ